MKVRFYGFALESECPMEFENIFDKAIEKHDLPIKAGDHSRLFYINTDIDPDYYVGLVLTIKNQKKFCKLTDAGGTPVISVENLNGDEKLMEFNYFVIHKKTHTGLFQYYHHSCTVSQACIFLKQCHLDARKDIISNTTDKKVKKAHTNKPLKFQIIVREDDLEKVMASWQRVKYMQVDYVALTANTRDFQQLTHAIKKERRRISFKPTNQFRNLIKPIKNILTDEQASNPIISGVDQNGETETIILDNTPTNYGELEFDELVAKLDGTRPSDFSDNWAIKTLIQKHKRHIIGHAN